MVSRMHLSVTLYVHCLSCYNQSIHYTKLVTISSGFFTHLPYNHLYINYIVVIRHPEDGHKK